MSKIVYHLNSSQLYYYQWFNSENISILKFLRITLKRKSGYHLYQMLLLVDIQIVNSNEISRVSHLIYTEVVSDMVGFILEYLPIQRNLLLYVNSVKNPEGKLS